MGGDCSKFKWRQTYEFSPLDHKNLFKLDSFISLGGGGEIEK